MNESSTGVKCWICQEFKVAVRSDPQPSALFIRSGIGGEDAIHCIIQTFIDVSSPFLSFKPLHGSSNSFAKRYDGFKPWHKLFDFAVVKNQTPSLITEKASGEAWLNVRYKI